MLGEGLICSGGNHGRSVRRHGTSPVGRGTIVLEVTSINAKTAKASSPRAQILEGGSITGNVRLHADFPSKFLGNRRNVVIYLPPSYARSRRKRYPVLYLQDGQNVFDYRTSAFQMDWGMDEAAERLIDQDEIDELIMVGVYNTDARFAEYTPPFHSKMGGRADDYASFMIDELKPFLDRTYRTQPEREATGVLGSSLGGLCSLYLAFTRGDVFGRVGAVSPSLWWGQGAMTRYVEETPGLRVPDRVWLDMGTEEGRPKGSNISYAVEGVRRLRRVLLDQGYVEGKTLFYLEAEGGVHNELSWGARAPQMLQALYPRTGRRR